MKTSVDIMEAGFACLVENLGVVDAERFVSMIKRENFDYTIWRREYFDKLDLDQISIEAKEYVHRHPHSGRGIRV